MQGDKQSRLSQWIASGEATLQPLTFPQRELWEASLAAPGDVANNICAMISIRGAMTPEGSEAAMQRVVERQETFRLSFLPGKDGPLQLIRRTAKPALQFQTLTSEQCSSAAIEALAQAVFDQPFDLIQGPLYRARVFSLSRDEHVLAFAIHHSIADGWTLGIFVQDLFNAYALGLRGSNNPLPPLRMSYSQWGAAERAYWTPEVLAPRLHYWREKLSGSSRPWATVRSGTMQRHGVDIPALQANAIRELARKHGATLFSTLLAAFRIALGRWCGAANVAVGTPVANRHHQAVRETAGYCSGIVPLLARLHQGDSFAKTVEQSQQSTVEAFANAVPFAELHRALAQTDEPSVHPIFSIRFALQNHPVPDVEVPGLSLRLRMRSTGTPRFDLACEINEQGEALSIAWLYWDGQFSSAAIEEFSGLFVEVLGRVCTAPETLIFSLLSASR